MYRMLYNEAESVLYGGADKNTLGVYKFSTYGIDKTEAEMVWYAFRYDAPEFFIISNTYLSQADSIEALIAPEFKDKNERERVLNSLSASLEQVRQLLTGIDDEAFKFKIIYDYVIDNTEYKRDASGKDVFDGYSCSIAGALDGDESTKSICQGYSFAISYLCNVFGIESIYVGSGNIEHSLNMAKIAGEWYYADATYDDTDGDYLYFLKKSDAHWTSAISSSSNEVNDRMISFLPKIESGEDCDCVLEKGGLSLRLEGRNYFSVISCDSSVTDADIPSAVYKMQVRYIADRAFSNRDNLKSVKIPETVEYVGVYAFSGCSNLASIEIPDSITYFSDGMFYGCASLTNVTLPKTLTGIGWYAFGDCSNLVSIEVPIGVRMGYRVFEDCYKLTIYCQAGSQPEDWEKEWNYGNRVVIWDSGNVKHGITDSGLQWLLTDGETIEVAGYCGSAAHVEIPSEIDGVSVTGIRGYAFNESNYTKSVYIPRSVEVIGRNAFYNCKKIRVIYCQTSEEPSGWNNSWNSSNLTVIWNSDVNDHGETDDGILWHLTNEDTIAIVGCITDATQLKLPSTINEKSVGVIYNAAFRGCGNLSRVDVPNSVTKIESSAFYGCRSVLYCEAEGKPMGYANNWNWNCPVVWNCKYNEVADDGKLYYVSDEGIKYVLNDGEATISMEFSGITSVAIPASIVYKGNSYKVVIGDYCFRDCHNLTSVRIAEGITGIGDYAFYYCYDLQSVEISSSVTSIGSYAFAYCGDRDFKNIWIPNSVAIVGEYVFYGVSTSLVVYCESPDRPSGWDENWNVYGNSPNLDRNGRIEVYWNEQKQ